VRNAKPCRRVGHPPSGGDGKSEEWVILRLRDFPGTITRTTFSQ